MLINLTVTGWFLSFLNYFQNSSYFPFVSGRVVCVWEGLERASAMWCGTVGHRDLGTCLR